LTTLVERFIVLSDRFTGDNFGFCRPAITRRLEFKILRQVYQILLFFFVSSTDFKTGSVTWAAQ
jgi:hypothetical protein